MFYDILLINFIIKRRIVYSLFYFYKNYLSPFKPFHSRHVKFSTLNFINFKTCCKTILIVISRFPASRTCTSAALNAYCYLVSTFSIFLRSQMNVGVRIERQMCLNRSTCLCTENQSFILKNEKLRTKELPRPGNVLSSACTKNRVRKVIIYTRLYFTSSKNQRSPEIF